MLSRPGIPVEARPDEATDEVNNTGGILSRTDTVAPPNVQQESEFPSAKCALCHPQYSSRNRDAITQARAGND
jgi:hypothetical protein